MVGSGNPLPTGQVARSLRADPQPRRVDRLPSSSTAREDGQLHLHAASRAGLRGAHDGGHDTSRGRHRPDLRAGTRDGISGAVQPVDLQQHTTSRRPPDLRTARDGVAHGNGLVADRHYLLQTVAGRLIRGGDGDAASGRHAISPARLAREPRDRLVAPGIEAVDLRSVRGHVRVADGVEGLPRESALRGRDRHRGSVASRVGGQGAALVAGHGQRRRRRWSRLRRGEGLHSTDGAGLPRTIRGE